MNSPDDPLRDLAGRLAAAEATIRALRAGQVDAAIAANIRAPLSLARAQEALRASEDRYRYIVETTSEGIWLIDAALETTFMNRRMAEMLGCAADTALGRSPFEFLDEAGRAELTMRVEAGKAHQAEVRFVRSDGSSVWALVDRTPMVGLDGRPDGWLAMAKDVTERRRAAAAWDELSRRTQLRERILSTTLAAISDFAYIYDRDGRFLFVNQPLLTLWGLTLEEAVGKNFADLGYPDHLAVRLQREVQEVVDTAERRTGETPYTSPAGQLGIYEYIFTPVFAADGRVEFVAGCTRDISARKRIERDLVARTTELEQQAAVLAEQAALLDLAPDAIIVRSMASTILYWNRGAERTYGWLAAEAIGRDSRELLRTEFPLPFDTITAQFLRDGQWDGELGHYTRDGRRLIIASHWTLLRDANGEPAKTLTTNKDITSRKQAEADRRILTDRLALAADVAQVGVWEWDLASGVLTWDATMFGIYGMAPILPMRYEQWTAAVHPDDLAGVEAILQDAVTRKGQGAAEFRVIRPDGSIRSVSAVERVVLDERMAVARVVGVNIDITEQQAAEAALRAARDAAEAANRAKSEFLANMSHEIRTPMNGVIGMTELVLDSELSSEQREHLGIVKSSADALLGVIDDILDFSKIEAGRLSLDAINFSARDTIGNTANALAWRAQQKGLEFIADVDDSVPQMLLGDPGRLRQVLVNLLGNAIKFTHKGEVVLRVTREPGATSDIVLHFSIRDTGIGIAPDRQQSVFQPFTQADGSTTRSYGGTGLGLTIAHQLVELMGGTLWVDSAPDRGSTFHFTATFGSIDGHVAAAVVPDLRVLEGVPVLVTDDNATNRQLLEGMLLGWRMIPTSAASAAQALAALHLAQAAGEPIRLVLTDVLMPGADGFTLAGAIKEDPAIAGAAVVVLTSGGRPGDVARCRDLGVAAYLQKPVNRSELRAAMLIALGSTATAPPEVVTRYTLRAARLSGCILVVDDNPINQLVTKRLLEKRGHTVVGANTAPEALTLLDAGLPGEFGCVIMSLALRGLDGIACASLIRDRERAGGGHLPIIAMVAREADVSRCIEAGMDAHISDPIEATELYATVDRYFGGVAANPPA